MPLLKVDEFPVLPRRESELLTVLEQILAEHARAINQILDPKISGLGKLVVLTTRLASTEFNGTNHAQGTGTVNVVTDFTLPESDIAGVLLYIVCAPDVVPGQPGAEHLSLGPVAGQVDLRVAWEGSSGGTFYGNGWVRCTTNDVMYYDLSALDGAAVSLFCYAYWKL